MRTLKVASMGKAGSFHEQAAKQYFSKQEIEVISASSFTNVVKAVLNNECDYCVLAIENSIAGSILPNYVLAEESGLRIIGEIYLPVELHLAVKPGTELKEIVQVKSHPMALYQCAPFLSSLGSIRLVESPDTVSAAQEVAAAPGKNQAAITNAASAIKHGLHILQENIESSSNNYTRFWVLSKGETINEEADKATICFLLEDYPGSLAKLLNVFSRNLVNFSRVQSVPLPDDPSTFRFYADVSWPEKQLYKQALKKAQKQCKSFTIMGEYTAASLNKSLKTLKEKEHANP